MCYHWLSSKINKVKHFKQEYIPERQGMMAAPSNPFRCWLTKRLLEFNPPTNTAIFVNHITEILEGDGSEEEKRESITELLRKIMDEGQRVVCEEIFNKWELMNESDIVRHDIKSTTRTNTEWNSAPCNTAQPNPDNELKPKRNFSWKKIGFCAGVGVLTGVVLLPAAVAGAGFTAGGIVAGSLAAKMMSAAAIANGGGVVAGGIVATLQSVGVLGFSATTTALVGGAAAGTTACLTGVREGETKPKDKKE